MGILGGTFNPPHRGHLALARHARAELGLDSVLLVPASSSPHKPAAPDPGGEHRLRMCELLVRDCGGVRACALELRRGGVSYTVDTLTELHAGHPHAELTLILGADAAVTLPSWREPQTLVRLARLAVAERAGISRERVLESMPEAAVRFLTMPVIEISSSQCRRRAGGGEPIEDLVGEGVAGYIAQHGLYCGQAPG
jgi:nicotinate-nucleotide adenylyltransferase